MAKASLAQGNAADALVGTVFCVGVVGMYDSGIGGGGFALIRDADGEYEAVDFRETAPAAAHKDMYRGNVNGSVIGGLAVAVPGELRGIEYIHFKYGVRLCSLLFASNSLLLTLRVQRLPWKLVMQGAIHVARNGFRGWQPFPPSRPSFYTLTLPRLLLQLELRAALVLHDKGTILLISSYIVSEDMIRKFRIVNAIDDENSFLVKDPNFAIDFAPNGSYLFQHSTPMAQLQCLPVSMSLFQLTVSI